MAHSQIDPSMGGRLSQTPCVGFGGCVDALPYSGDWRAVALPDYQKFSMVLSAGRLAGGAVLALIDFTKCLTVTWGKPSAVNSPLL